MNTTQAQRKAILNLSIDVTGNDEELANQILDTAVDDLADNEDNEDVYLDG